MKKLIYPFLVCISLAFFSCGDAEKIKEMQAEVDSMQEKVEEKEQAVNSLLSSVNLIQENLKKIKTREGILRVNTGENNTTPDIESINKDIELISNLMIQNEELIDQLNQQVKESGIKLDQFRKLIEGMKQRLKDKNLEIAKLNDELKEKNLKIDQLYFSVDSLTYANRIKDRKIEEKIDEINRAYYAYGTFKELKEKNVLTKEGGFLGLGKSQELKNNFNKEYFSRIDISKQKSFLIYAKKAKLITNHPTGSYRFDESDDQIDSLTITNAEDFWRASKYLVIVIE